MKALRYILYSLVILGAGALLAYQYFVEQNLETGNIIKCGLIIAAAILGMVRPRKSRIVNKKLVYQKAYSEFVEGAFQNDPKLERVFYNAVHDYNRNKFSGAIAKLEKLRKEGFFDNCAAVVFGRLSRCKKGEKQVKQEFADKLKCPVYDGFPYSHTKRNHLLDLRKQVEITEKGTLKFL